MNEKTIKDLFPQQETYTRLAERFSRGKLPASLLLTGPRGVGKWSVGYELAKCIVCLNSSVTAPCGACASCKQHEQFAHPDVHFLFPLPANDEDWKDWYSQYLSAKQEKPFAPSTADPKQFIPIEAIRQFQSKLARRSTLSVNKVGIIYEAERMLPGTMDSLLKLLEEPPDKSFLFVVTPEPRFLLPTILSRLQRVNLPVLDDQFVRTYLETAYRLDKGQAETLVPFVQGQLYDVDTILQGDFIQQRQAALEMIETSTTASRSDIVTRLGESGWLTSRDKVESFLRHWQSILRDQVIVVSSDTNDPRRLTNPDFAERYSALKTRLNSLERIEELSDRIEQIRIEVRRNVNPRMAALSFLLQLSPEKANSQIG